MNVCTCTYVNNCWLKQALYLHLLKITEYIHYSTKPKIAILKDSWCIKSYRRVLFTFSIHFTVNLQLSDGLCYCFQVT